VHRFPAQLVDQDIEVAEIDIETDARFEIEIARRQSHIAQVRTDA
jgi:hypothetical protein